MSSKQGVPASAIQVDTYQQLDQIVDAFAAGHLNLLLLVGPPGVAKSQTVRRRLTKDTCWIEGNATAFGLYTKLHQHRDQNIVIDDVDGLYSDRAAVRLLKCVCQTDPVKRLGWNTSIASGDLPTSFETKSRVVIIANDWRTLNDNVAAVIDRGHFVVFAPPAEEVHQQATTWFDDGEILDWFAEHLHLIPSPSMRQYVRAAELKAAGLDWIGVTISQWLPTKTALVAQLKADRSYASEADRIVAFQKQGGGSRATYFNHAKRLRTYVRQAA